MAIVYDASASVATATNGTVSQSITVTVGASGVAYLWIGIRWIDAATGPGISLTSVDVDGSAASFIGTRSNSGFSEAYGFRVTASGTYTVNANFTPTDITDIANCVLGIISFTSNSAGSDIQVGTAQTAAGTTSPITVNVTGVSTNNMVADSAGKNNLGTVTVGGGQTQRWNASVGAASARQTGVGSHEASAVGTVTMSWTISTNRNWSTVAAEIQEVAAGNDTLPLLCVG